MAPRPLIAVSMWLLLLLQLAGASNPPDKLSRLLSNSPFGQSRAGATAGNGAGDPFEFRSVLEENGNKLFSIYETGTRRSIWVEMNDPVNGFSVKGYSPASESVTVEYQNRSLILPIKRAAPVVQTTPFPLAPGGMAPASNNPTLQPGTSPVDQQRLQQIQEEIRRRRALRQQALPPSNQGGFEGGPQPMPSNSSGPQPMPSNPSGAYPMPANSPGQPVPAKP